MKSPKMSGKPQEKWTAIRWIAREELLLMTTANAVSEKGRSRSVRVTSCAQDFTYHNGFGSKSLATENLIPVPYLQNICAIIA